MYKSKTAQLLLIAILGIVLIGAGNFLDNKQVKTNADGVTIYNAAYAALEKGQLTQAADLFLEAVDWAKDSNLKAASYYNAATVAWVGRFGQWDPLVENYKESLRNKPDFENASFNLELLYFLKENSQLQQSGPNNDDQGQKGGKRVPGNRP